MGSVKILKASAGSGKTYRLAYEYIRNVIESPWLYRSILAVTFTNKATEEMKSRIVGEINALANGAETPYFGDLESDLSLTREQIQSRAVEARTKILHDYSHFAVVTIDKFFQRIIRSFIKELGIDLNFTLELQTDTILESATDSLIDDIAVDTKLKNWVMRFIEEQIDDNKGWDVRSQISELGREIFREHFGDIAANSSSKEELEAIVIEAQKKSAAIKRDMSNIAVLALDIVEKAAVRIDDFAYGRGGCMSYFVKVSDGVIEPYGKRVSDALISTDKWVSKNSPHRAEIESLVTRLQPMLTELCSLYDSNIRFLNSSELLTENFRSFALLTDLSQRISKICAEQNIMPISETNNILSKLISGNDTPFIYEKVGNAFSHFMIDEFQDTSAQQWANFVPLLHNALAQSSRSPVLLVGDVKQSIYRWRGGDWKILGSGLEREFSDLDLSTLDTNYRSEGVVVDFNNSIIDVAVQSDNALLNDLVGEAFDKGAISRNCRTELTDMLSQAYQDHRQKSSKQLSEGYVRITELAKDAPSPVISTIEDLQRRGYSAGDIAILVRYNREGSRVAAELLDYKAAHPESSYCYDVVTQEALVIGNSSVVGFIIAIFRLAMNLKDSINRAIFNRYKGREIDSTLSDCELTFISSLRLQPLDEAFESVVIEYGLNACSEDVAYIQALQEQVHNFSTSRISDIPLFLSWWEQTGSRQSISLPRSSNAITIISIHKAKGLQYRAVVVPFCDWDLQPKTRQMLWAGSEPAISNTAAIAACSDDIVVNAVATPISPFDRLGRVPIRLKKDMGESFFAEEYYREVVLSHIDNVNTFYVAATRAKEELHIVIPKSGGRRSSIGALLLGTLRRSDAQSIVLSGLQGRYSDRDEGTIFEFGSEHLHEARSWDVEPMVEYPTCRVGAKLRLSFDSDRYFGDESDVTLSPRSYGVIMHKVFEQIDDFTQIDIRLEEFRAEGVISADEFDRVKELIEFSLQDPLVRSWFDPKWDVVRNESAIITPGESVISRRPDRVVTKGNEAVVVDYKFGSVQRNSYVKQMREYMQLLSRMGYRNIKGYIWYVEQREITITEL